jgi:RNA polymerase sigma factor (sigma-70 family)
MEMDSPGQECSTTLDLSRGIPIKTSGMKSERAEAAAVAFWKRLIPCKSKLYNYIHKTLNFSVEAEDVYQETVLHAFQYLRTFQEDKDFGAWLFGIAHNEIKKHFRKTPRKAVPIDVERLGGSDSSHEQHLVGEIYRFAERLKPRQREVFFLFYDQGFSIPEIARISGFREGNVKFILNRARNTLKTLMGDHDE